MLNLWIFGAFLLGYALCAVTSMGGPVSLAMIRLLAGDAERLETL